MELQLSGIIHHRVALEKSFEKTRQCKIHGGVATQWCILHHRVALEKSFEKLGSVRYTVELQLGGVSYTKELLWKDL